MAKTTVTQITINTDGDGVESEWKPTAMQNDAGRAGGPVQQTLAVGDNTIAVPTGAMGMVLKQAEASAATVRLKGVAGAGETGFALRTGKAACVPIPTGATGVVLYSSAVDLVDLHWT